MVIKMKMLKPEDVSPVVKITNYKALEKGKTGFCWNRRRIPDFELILSIRGDFEFINHDTGQRALHPPGAILVILPQEFHSYRLITDKGFFSCIHCELMPRGIYAAGDYFPEPFPARLTMATDSELHDLFRRAANVGTESGRLKEVIRNTIVREIWLRLSAQWLSGTGGKKSLRLNKMLKFLDDNLTTFPSRAELADKFHLTPQHINLVFKKELGLSPTGYVHRELARAGYRMLHEDGLTVKETAEHLGFSSQFYFSKIFKKVFGTPPRSV